MEEVIRVDMETGKECPEYSDRRGCSVSRKQAIDAVVVAERGRLDHEARELGAERLETSPWNNCPY